MGGSAWHYDTVSKRLVPPPEGHPDRRPGDVYVTFVAPRPGEVCAVPTTPLRTHDTVYREVIMRLPYRCEAVTGAAAPCPNPVEKLVRGRWYCVPHFLRYERTETIARDLWLFVLAKRPRGRSRS